MTTRRHIALTAALAFSLATWSHGPGAVAATIVPGDVTDYFGNQNAAPDAGDAAGLLFDEARTGGGDTAAAAAFSPARILDGVSGVNNNWATGLSPGLAGAVTFTGLGFPLRGGTTATTMDLTISYLGADGVLGGIDDVVVGTVSNELSFSVTSEYVWEFDTPLSFDWDGLATNFRFEISGSDGAGNPLDLRFKSRPVGESPSGQGGIPLSVGGSFVPAGGPPPEWNIAGSGLWNTASNWTSDPQVPGVGGLVDSQARFLGAITAPATVTLNVNPVVDTIVFDNANAYTIANGGGNSLTLSGAATIQATSGEHVIGAPILGSAGLKKTGAGTVTLSGANAYTGFTSLNAGTLAVSSNGNLGNAANGLDFNGGGLQINGTTFTALSRSVTMTGAGTVNVADAANNLNVTGAVSGAGALTKTGDGSLALANAAALDGNINVNGGTLVVRSNTGLGTTVGGTQVASAAGTVELDGSGGNLTIAENFNRILARNVNNPTAHIRNTAGNNQLTGAIDVGGAATTYGNFENAANGTTLTINNAAGAAKVFDSNDGDVNIRFQGTGNFKIGNENTPGTGKIVGPNVDVIVALTDPTDRVTIATAVASTDTTNATGSYWGGSTTIESGTLAVLQDGLNAGELASSSIDVRAGATFDVSNFTTYSLQVVSDPDATPGNGDEIGQLLTGGGTINTGGNTIRAFEDSRIAPGDGVGTLQVTGNLNVGLFAANPSGGFEFDLGNATTIGGGVNDLLAVSNTLTLAPSGNKFNLRVTPAAGSLAAGTYTLMTGGSIAGGAASGDFNLSLFNPQGTLLNSRQDNASVVNVTGSAVTVSFAAAAARTWTGAVNGVWNVGSTANWSAGDNLFFDLDAVTFGNGPTNTTIDIAAPVTPGSMNFTNTTSTYTFTGVGIEGSGAMTLNANAKAVLANSANSFIGGVTIANGATLTLGDGASNTGQLAANSSVVDNGTLIYDRVGYSFNTQTISGTGGVVVNSGYIDMARDNTYSGVTTINDGTLRARQSMAMGSADGTVATGTVVNGGSLDVGYFANASVNEHVTLTAGGALNATYPTDNFATPANSGQVTWTAPIVVSGTGGRVGTDAGDGIVPGMTIAGGVSGSGALDLAPAANRILAVSSNLAHTGDTTVSGAGRTVLQGTAAITNSPSIELKAGATLDVTTTGSGALALSSQMLRGAGTVVGNVTTTANSTLRVGGVAAGLASVTTGRQLNYDAALDIEGDDVWSDSEPNAGVVDLDFGNGQATPVAVSDPTFTALTKAYDIPTSGAALSPGADNAYFDSRALNAGTFEVVFNVTNAAGGNDQVLMDIGGGTGVSLLLNGAVLTAGVNGVDTVTADTIAYSTGALSTGWHHAVVVIGAGAGATDEFTLYVDNAVVGSPANTNQIDDWSGGNGWGFGGPNSVVLDGTQTNAGPATIVSPNDYHGQIAVARYYQAALTASDVNTNFLALQAAPFVGVDTFTVDGNLTLDATSTVQIDIFDATVGNDLLSVSGNLAAAGTLDVSLVGTVGLGDSFDILDFASLSGSFGAVNLPLLSGGLAWDQSSLLSTGVLSVISGGSTPGDFNGDNKVNGADFLAWQRGYPGTYGASDLTDWESNFGVGAPAIGASAGVPEPAALLLAALSAGCLVASRRKRLH
ncbi:MAG: autotransporter-associated beta strand repeat-containing protein [Planctomycetales bacterium]|nr:autotransporter-associated beta strand repeat-containing protein [Planctomycetales bacterium]